MTRSTSKERIRPQHVALCGSCVLLTIGSMLAKLKRFCEFYLACLSYLAVLP